ETVQAPKELIARFREQETLAEGLKSCMKWPYRVLVSTVSLLGLAAAGRLAMAHRHHSSTFGHVSPLGLHADVIVRTGSIGIPGVSKMYEAVLTNYGLLPVPIVRCEYLDDTLSRGTMIAYRVERWNRKPGKWDVIVNMNSPDFCKPYPLGIVEARLTTRWLWPGQSLATGEEATAARDPLEKGDSARFAVYLRTGDSNSESIPTAGFAIDESPTVDADALRVRH
ncbi:MAG: hypothetical protein JNL62_15575, partial [Bryobacterales bacterium]|nr:hypothetical protein [Bryobacterales bacterium]